MIRNSICILFFLIIDTLSCQAQGIYFDSLYHAEETIYSSAFAQIFSTDSGYVTVGLHINENNYFLEKRHLDFDGTSIQTDYWGWPTPNGALLWYGKAFIPLSDGGYLWSNEFSIGTGIIKLDQNLDTEFTIVFPGIENDFKRLYHFFEADSSYIGASSIMNWDGQNYSSQLEIIELNFEGEMLNNDTISLYDNEYQLAIEGIHKLSDGGFLVSGARLFDWDPILVKFDSNGQFVSEYHWGGQYNDWLPFLEPVGVDSFMVSYAETENQIGSFHISKPKLMLFNASTMEPEWTGVAQDSIIQLYGYSIASTSDNGIVTCGNYLGPYGYEYGFIQKWSSSGEELWAKTYRHLEIPEDSLVDRQALWDITEAPDSGLIACGYYYNGNSDPQHAWVLKLDGCGDPIFDSCVVVYDGVWTGKNIPALNNLFVWPNPFQDHLNIQLPEPSAIVDILDVMGNLVYSTRSYQFVAKLDLSNLPVGVYIIRARLEIGEVLSKKVIKSE